MSEEKKSEEVDVTSSSTSLKIPKEREKLINLGVFPFKLPQKPLNMHQSARLGHPYAELRRHPFVRTFLHEAGVSLNTLQREGVGDIFCNLTVVRNTYVDGEVKFFLDFTHLPAEQNATRRVAVVHEEKGSLKIPHGMTGTIMTVSLPENVGLIIIGDAMSAMH
jgi:hypothetical protein